MDKVRENLERYYNTFQEITDFRAFFLALRDYVEYIVEEPQLQSITDKLSKEYHSWTKRLLKMESDSLDELDKTEARILLILKENQIQDERIEFVKHAMGRYKDNLIFANILPSEQISGYLFEIIKIVSEIKSLALFNEFTVKELRENYGSNRLVLSKALEKEGYFIKQYELELDTKVWGCWSHLFLVIMGLFDKELLRLENSSIFDQKLKRDYITLKIDLIKEMEAAGSIGSMAMQLPEAEKWKQKIKKYKFFASRLHNHLLAEITSKESPKQDPSYDKFKIKVYDRKIYINSYLIAKPHAVGVNFDFLEYIINQKSHTKISRENLPNAGGVGIKNTIGNKGFIKILNSLGFKGAILKAFFYKRSNDSFVFRGNQINREDLENAGIKIDLFIKELELANSRNNPT